MVNLRQNWRTHPRISLPVGKIALWLLTENTDGKVEKIEFYVTYGDNNTFVMYNKPIYGILLLSYMDDIIKAHGRAKERNIPDKIFLTRAKQYG